MSSSPNTTNTSERLTGRATAREPHGDGVRGRSPREERAIG